MAELIETDVLILGCGVAGGTVALRLADAGVPVTLVTRAADPRDSNTLWAPGRDHLSRKHECCLSFWWPISFGLGLTNDLETVQHIGYHRFSFR